MASAYSRWIREDGEAHPAAFAWLRWLHRRCTGAEAVRRWPTETWEHNWETSGKRQAWTCGGEPRRAGRRPGSPFPTVRAEISPAGRAEPSLVLAPGLGRGWWCTGCWIFIIIVIISFFSSKAIQLPARWSWEHKPCRKSSFGEKSVCKEFWAYAHPGVWNCFTLVTSNTSNCHLTLQALCSGPTSDCGSWGGVSFGNWRSRKCCLEFFCWYFFFADWC